MKNIDLNEIFSKIKERFQIQKAGTIKLSAKEKINLLEQLSNLINSGIPITNAFSIISYQTKDPKIKALVADLLEKINKWIPLRESCAAYSQIFSSFDIAIIEMWEVTWKLGDSIELIKEKEEKNTELKSKIIWALTYPMVVIALSIAMIITFMLFVIPKIQKMYDDAKVNLPGLTEFVINTSVFLQENIVIIWAILALAIVWLSYLKTNPKTKIYFDKYVLELPIFGSLIRKKVLSLFARNLSTLLSSWIIINKALEITKKSLENAYYEKELDNVMIKISNWISLSEAMWIKLLTTWKESEFFPLELSSLVKIWEQTGKLPNLLGKISIRYNKEIDNIVKNLATAIEPIVIVWVWWIVWTMIMAILLPFFNMVNVVGK